MSISSKIKKIKQHSDIVFLMRIFLESLRVSFYHSRDNWKQLLTLSDPKSKIPGKNDRVKVYKYVQFCLIIRYKLGFKDNCFTTSVLMCRMLRKFGIDAQLNFGAKKHQEELNKELSLLGHCWVTINGEANEPEEEFTFMYNHPE